MFGVRKIRIMWLSGGKQLSKETCKCGRIDKVHKCDSVNVTISIHRACIASRGKNIP